MNWTVERLPFNELTQSQFRAVGRSDFKVNKQFGVIPHF